MTVAPASNRRVYAAVLLAALGYLVDIYDLILFSIIRIKSLEGIGVPPEELLSTGVLLLNMQMGGMLVGGILWGVLGDKRGRLSVLFGSIMVYSLANIANAFVDSVPAYAVVRLIAGIGLAGELGAGITLVSELMSKEARGYGTMVVAGVGFFGGILAAVTGDMLPWRTAYFVGGAMGLLLLLLRIGVYESGMFSAVLEQKDVERGNFWMLFRDRDRALRYLYCILIGLPIWFVLGILITFSPEMGKALGMAVPPTAGKAFLYVYIGAALGDFVAGFISQKLRSRKKTLAGFLIAKLLVVAAYLCLRAPSLEVFYGLCGLLGLSSGYWAVFVTVASEQFGTNIRATVTTTAPNFVRGATVPVTSSFQLLKPGLGIVPSAALVGAVCFAIALFSLSRLKETFGKDLDYLES
ncbi:MAG: MFS transporter [Elusimicrobia bacterium]|nr:MFS transporter [Elusimicrobiota bacterium]